MAKYLRPRRGPHNYASSQNIVLRSGEMFLEIPNNTVFGKTPGRIIIGDGSSSYSSLVYSSTISTDYKPFITDPSLYSPIFNNSTYSTSNWSVSIATSSIDAIGNGSGNVDLPTIIGAIKEVLCKHEDSIRALENNKANGAGLTFRVDNDGILNVDYTS